jgi:DNA repair protein RecO (recombination protein O)
MAVTATAATVLHMQDYLESSRIYRLLTREAGVISVVARGVRRGGRRATSPPDLFAGGVAQVDLREGRDLHGLREFELTVPRLGLSAALSRFSAAGAVAEVALRFIPAEPTDTATIVVEEGLDALNVVAPERADDLALGVLWRLVAALGLAPTIRSCALCGIAVDALSAEVLPFHHRSGGILCLSCAAPLSRHGSRQLPGGRSLPGSARRTLHDWIEGRAETVRPEPLSAAEVTAHQRLLREFLTEHLTERRDLRAYLSWEGDRAHTPPRSDDGVVPH